MSISRKYKESGTYPTRKTGHIADLISLSDEGVRMYERYGLVYPEKEDQNGYRAFDVMDTTMLLYGKVYRDCGFSLKEAGHLANHAALPEVDQAYTDLIARRERMAQERPAFMTRGRAVPARRSRRARRGDAARAAPPRECPR